MAKRKPKPERSAENMETQAPPGKPKRSGLSLHVYVQPALRQVLDEVVDESDPKTNATAVVETALRRYFASIGKWPRSGRGDG
jgi:hypothetical protein